MLKKIISGHLVTIAVLYALLIACLLLLDPYDMPAFLLFAPFVLFFAATFLSLYRIFGFFARKTGGKFRKTHAARTAFLLAGLPTFLVLLQSVGQVGAYDILISIILFGGIDFYLARSKFQIFNTDARS